MALRENGIKIVVGDRQVAGTIVSPSILMEGVLFVHGWKGSQEQYLIRARELAALDCICVTFNLYGHVESASFMGMATRQDNLNDVMAAYDFLIAQPFVDKSAIAVIGSSYGGYLAALLTTVRPVRWLALRAPALYKDEDWVTPKELLDRQMLMAYRRTTVNPTENRALAACAKFTGDVLLVESEFDDIVPSPVTANYRTAFAHAHSLTFRCLSGADHALSDARSQQEYTSLLKNWASEIIVSARRGRYSPPA